MRRRLALVGLVVALLGVFGMNTAVGAPDDDRNTGEACPEASPQPDNTPPNCGNDAEPGGGGGAGGGGGGGGGGGTACPDPSHNPGGTPPNCGQCPEGPGAASNGGCPVEPCDDTDADGVCDEDDNCPTDPGPASNDGCPEPPCDDTDADGVCDEDDNCPTDPGPASNDGCPEPPQTYAGPCHRGEGLNGGNPIAEQLRHGLEAAGLGELPVAHPGAETTPHDGENDSLGGISKTVYEIDDLEPLTKEGGCATDLAGL